MRRPPATFTPDPDARSLHELGRQPRCHGSRHARRTADHHQRQDDRPDGIDDGEQGQRVCAHSVRPDRDELQRHPLRLPPDVQHLVGEDDPSVGRRPGQHRVHRRDRSRAALPRPGRRFRPASSAWTAAATPSPAPPANFEESGVNSEPTDADDDFCFPGSEAPRIHVSMCTDTNTGFDGQTYQPVWPDGNTALHPTSWQFSSPLTGSAYNVRYSRAVFEVDLPDIEFDGGGRPVQSLDGRALHALPAHRRRPAGCVLSVLQHDQHGCRLPLAVRQPHPRLDQ